MEDAAMTARRKRTVRRVVHRGHDVLGFRITADQARLAIRAARHCANNASSIARTATLEDIKRNHEYEAKLFTELADSLVQQFNEE
jgi:hypothetical protein